MSPRGGKSAEKLMLAKVLDLQEKIVALEEQVKELVAQNNQLQDELERRGEELESEARNAVELKGEFLRIKHENFDLRNELEVANKHNDQHFEQLQHAVSRSEHDNVVSEYKMQLDALAREHSLQLTDKFGEDGPKLDATSSPKTSRSSAVSLAGKNRQRLDPQTFVDHEKLLTTSQCSFVRVPAAPR